LHDLGDTDYELKNATDGQVLTYDSTIEKWTAKNPTGGGGTTDQFARDTANSATTLAQAAFNTANNANTRTIINGLGNSKLDLNSFGSNTAYLTTTSDDSTALFMGAVSADLYAHTNILIRTNTAGVSKNWTFGEDGTITFPDSTIQNTAFTGTAIDQAARNTANASFNFANTANITAEAAFAKSNSANTLAQSAYDSSNTKIATTGGSFTGTVTFNNTRETLQILTGATGTVNHDCANSLIFVHNSPSANFTANFTNLTITANTGTSVTIVINQGGTAYIANAVSIGGSAQTVNWQGSTTPPSGNANKKDAMSFTMLNNNGTFLVLGQLTTFG
jgi:hypothetical protein